MAGKKVPGPELMLGSKYGMLTVISERKVEQLPTRKVFYYECKCDCGGIKKARHEGLKNGTVRTCGCLSNQLRSQKTKETLARKKERALGRNN